MIISFNTYNAYNGCSVNNYQKTYLIHTLMTIFQITVQTYKRKKYEVS